LNVYDNIRAIAELLALSPQEREAYITQSLEMFGLLDVRDHMATSLSGGQRRRLELARALATGPEFLLLDEPFAGIDPVAIDDICGVINALKDSGIGILITDHNVYDTLNIIQRGYVLIDGHILTAGTPDDIRADTITRERYLGSAVTR
ncbi:MAG: ATP-binding cassette domain-containing protein, partial [Pseudomonadota bacterium]